MTTPTHKAECACVLCEKLRTKTLETEAWRKKHRAHLGGAGLGFTTEPFAHPSGDWSWLVCPCGAKQLTVREP